MCCWSVKFIFDIVLQAQVRYIKRISLLYLVQENSLQYNDTSLLLFPRRYLEPARTGALVGSISFPSARGVCQQTRMVLLWNLHKLMS